MIENILKILKPNSMRRIDDIHILDIYIGLGQNAMPIVVVRSMIDIKLPKSSKNIEIIDNYKENEHSYYFCLKDMAHYDMFINIFNDIIEYSRKSVSEYISINLFVKRFIIWKNLFLKEINKSLTSNQIIGLYGELYYLKNFLSKEIGLDKSINSWLGPLSEKKDFEFDNKWREIKTVKYGSISVTISSIYQLDDINDGDLCVFEYSYTGSEKNNLYSIIEEILVDIKEDISLIEIFTSKLSEVGYEHKEEYANILIDFKLLHIIPIKKDTPIFRVRDIPKSVLDAEYKLQFRSMEGEIINELQ